MQIDRKTLSFEAFSMYYSSLRERKEVKSLYDRLSDAQNCISFPKFKEFCLDVQKVRISLQIAINTKLRQMGWTEEQCEDYYKKYSPADGSLMNFVHFQAFLLSANNSICKKSAVQLNHDMTKPINDYYIYSSHNT